MTSTLHWPKWVLALLCLLAGAWIEDEGAAPALLKATGVVTPWLENEPRALVGTWYLTTDEPQSVDARCARDVRLQYQLRERGDIRYTVECVNAQNQLHVSRGTVLKVGAQYASSAWNGTSRHIKLDAFAPRGVLLLQGVDHASGLASVRLSGTEQVLVLSRSRRSDMGVVRAFMHRNGTYQLTAGDRRPGTEAPMGLARM